MPLVSILWPYLCLVQKLHKFCKFTVQQPPPITLKGFGLGKKSCLRANLAVAATCKNTGAETIKPEVWHQNSTHQHFILQHKAKPTVSAQDSGKAYLN